MSRHVLAAAASAVAMCAAGVANAGVIYHLDVTTHYQFGGCANGICGNPDTGFVTFTNVGPSTFTGSLGIVAVGGNGVDYSQSYAEVLNPGDSFVIAPNDEFSNVGGFNGPSGSVQPGVTMFANGLFGATAANLSVNDADVHSGVFQTNPFGVTLDSYVLQGGDPLGRDTGDFFEVSQADGHFSFILSSSTPEPGTWAMMIIGLGAIGAMARRGRRNAGLASV